MLWQLRSPITEEEEELIVNLSTAYLKKREEWKEEGIYEVAMNLLREGIDITIILKVTGLSIEQINQLREQLN